MRFLFYCLGYALKRRKGGNQSKIGIIGLGKVGSAFLKACAVTAALQVVSVKAGRSPKSCARLAGMGDFQITSVGAEVLAAADVVLLAVPDGQIAAAAETLAAEVGTAGRRDILSKKVCLHLQRFFGVGPFGGAFCLGDPLRQSASIAELCRRQRQI